MCWLGSQFWLDAQKGPNLYVELMNDQPDAMKMHLSPLCGNLSRSADQPNSKRDRDRKKQGKQNLVPCSQSSSPGTEGRKNDTPQMGHTDLSKKGAHLEVKTTKRDRLADFGRDGGGLTLREKLGVGDRQRAFLREV